MTAADVASTSPATPTLLDEVTDRADRHLRRGIQAYEEGRSDDAREQFALVLGAFDEPGLDLKRDAKARAAYEQFQARLSLYDVQDLDAGDREPTPLEHLRQVEFSLRQPNSSAEREIREAMSSITFDLPVQVNDEVLSFIQYFRTRHRSSIEAGLRRSGRYLDMMRRIFKEEGLPQDLVYIALVESNYKPWALSRARARGIWQFIPATGRRYGLAQDSWLDERSDPEKSTRAAARYLKDLHAMFGDWYLAMAAYNCGENRVARARGGRDWDYWELSRRNLLPRETRRYVPAILAGMIVSKNPEAFGLTNEPEPPLRYDTVVLPDSTHLMVVSELTDTSFDYLKELNPEIRRGRTPGTAYSLRVPPGRGTTWLAELMALPPRVRAGSINYVIRRGDTLSRIAGRHGITARELADWNGISLRTILRIGAVLEIPVAGVVDGVGLAQRNGDDSGPRRVTYRVRRGDTLYRIARKYNVSVTSLAEWNRKAGRGLIHPGELLTILIE